MCVRPQPEIQELTSKELRQIAQILHGVGFQATPGSNGERDIRALSNRCIEVATSIDNEAEAPKYKAPERRTALSYLDAVEIQSGRSA